MQGNILLSVEILNICGTKVQRNHNMKTQKQKVLAFFHSCLLKKTKKKRKKLGSKMRFYARKRFRGSWRLLCDWFPCHIHSSFCLPPLFTAAGSGFFMQENGSEAGEEYFVINIFITSIFYFACLISSLWRAVNFSCKRTVQRLVKNTL